MEDDLSAIYFPSRDCVTILSADCIFFFGINGSVEAYRFDWNREVYSDRIEPNMLSIATTECADKLCLDLETGSVLFWDAYDEDDTGRRLYKIADSFEQFLNVLYRDELSPKIK